MSELCAVLEALVEHSPDRVAIQAESSSVSYAELWNLVQLAEYRLCLAGVVVGQRVAMLFRNAPDCVAVFLALAKLKVHVVLLSQETTVDDLRVLANEIGAVPLLCPSRLLDRFSQVVPTCVEMLIDIDVLITEEPANWSDLPSVVFTSDHHIYVYHYTSGTTGRPKVVIQSQQNLLNGARLYCNTYGITADDVILLAVPISHSFGLVAGLLTALLSGARLVLLERFAPANVLRLLGEQNVSILIGTPRVYELLLNLNPGSHTQLPMLRAALSSGSPVPLALSEHFANRFGSPLYEVYGSTETGIIAAQWPRSEGWPARSVGQPLTGVHIRIIDESGSDVPCGSTGQLIVHTPAMFLGYLNNPEASAHVLLQKWYRTGDLAWQNSDGVLFLVGRNPFLIQHGEQMINPLEVEAVLLSHPQVHEALVYANEVLCAAVVVEGNIAIDALLTFCRTHLTPSKVPESIIFVSELPRGELGKLRRIASGIRIV